MMAPILIDKQSLVKLGLVLLLITMFVFTVGYFSGYQKATTFYAMSSETEVLVLPEKNMRDGSDVEPRAPENKIAGEAIDVDQPLIDTNHNTQKKTAVNNKNNNNSVSIASFPSKDNDSVTTDKAKTLVLNTQVKSDTKNTDNRPPLEKYQPIEITRMSSDELNKIKYSVQVGMYGDLINAENMKNLLQVEHFDAYVSDYTNKKNKVRYNVRFGYFIDKKTALLALKKYRNSKTGDGYLVNFSVENIVNVADTKNSYDSVQQRNKTEGKDKTIPVNQPHEENLLEIKHSQIVEEEALGKVQLEVAVTNE